jgi:hypothetical protein
MSLIFPSQQTILVRTVIVAVVMVGACLALPAGAVSLPARVAVHAHKAKPLKTLRTSNAAPPAPAAAPGPSSPYALAAAQRDAAGLAPPGHARVLQRSMPTPAAPTPAAH